MTLAAKDNGGSVVLNLRKRLVAVVIPSAMCFHDPRQFGNGEPKPVNQSQLSVIVLGAKLLKITA